MKETTTCLLAGGYFANELTPFVKRRISKGTELILLPKTDETAEAYIERFISRLKKKLSEYRPKTLILELQSLLELLPEEMTKEETEKLDTWFAMIIKLLRKSFDKSSVYVITTHVPHYYIMGEDRIKPAPQDSRRKNAAKILRRYEKRVAARTEGNAILSTAFYFYRKESGYQINPRHYEEECYRDIAVRIADHVRNGIEIPQEPLFSCSLDRYIRYAGKTIYWNALQTILHGDHLVDRLVLAAPAAFVRKYRKKLIKARKIPYTTTEMWRAELQNSFADAPEFRQILEAFEAAERNDLADPAISYQEMFRSRIVSRPVLKTIQIYGKENHLAEPNQISARNAGYYYARMMGKPEEEAVTYVAKKTVITPPLLDVFGSCIARTAMREHYSGNTSVAVNNYWFQVPPYVESQPTVPYDPAALEGFSGINAQNVYLQLEGKVHASIRESKADWLLVDLYSLDQPHLYQYQGFIFSDFDGDIARRLQCEPVRIMDDPTILGDWETIFRRMDPWIQVIEERYGDHIILLDFRVSSIFQGDDRVLYQTKGEKKAKRQRRFYKQAFDYVRDHLQDCYRVKIADDFLPDDTGYQRRSTVHYGYDFYQQVFGLIKKIVYEHPEQKLYTSYDTDVKLQRMIEMLEQNPAAAVRQCFRKKLDGIVTELPVAMIRENMDTIGTWYEAGLETTKDILRAWQRSWDPALKRQLKKQKKQADAPKPSLPLDYIEEPVPGIDPIPYAPALYMRPEIDRTVSAVQELLTEPALVFACVTDIRYMSYVRKTGKPYAVTFQRMIANMKAVTEQIPCRFIMDLGNDIDGVPADLAADTIGRYMLDAFQSLKLPYYRTLGERDVHYGAEEIPQQDDAVYNPEAGQSEYYVDLKPWKIRLLVLHSPNGHTDSTGKWLAEKALQTKSLILLCGHEPCLQTEDPVVQALLQHEGPIVELCAETPSDAEQKAWPTIFCSQQRCMRKKDSLDAPQRKAGTETEDCWDVVVVRPRSGKIDLVRFGAGEDRAYDFSPIPERLAGAKDFWRRLQKKIERA